MKLLEEDNSVIGLCGNIIFSYMTCHLSWCQCPTKEIDGMCRVKPEDGDVPRIRAQVKGSSVVWSPCSVPDNALVWRL